MSVNSSPSIIRFGTFEVNLQTGELRHTGQKVKLQEQPFQVLAALLARPGEIVTREELRSKLWPKDTFVDFDHSLNAAIKRLRDALDESADAPVFIETMARRGYRFIAPVNSGSAPSGIGVAATKERAKFWSARPWIALSLLSLIVIAVVGWAFWRYSWRHMDIIERKLTANSLENGVSSAAVSPDGNYLAYGDTTGIYLKLIRTGETHPVPLPPDFSSSVCVWFPDGSHLLVSRREKTSKLSLWSVSVFGGSPRKLVDDAFAGSLSPDGAHIAFLRGSLAYGGLLGREEWVVRTDGTDQVRVAGDKSDGSQVGAPTWSPDGNRIAYIRASSTHNAQRCSIEVNEWQNASAETLISDSRLSPALHWLPDGRLIYALGNIQGPDQQSSSLWTVALQQSGKTFGSPKRVTTGPGGIPQIAASTDGKVLILLRDNWSPSVYIGMLSADDTQLLAHRRLTLDESVNIPFSWTPDSKAVLFTSNRNGDFEIFKQDIDQPLAESLVSSAEQVSQPRVTPDGSEILYVSTPKLPSPETPFSVFAIPVHGGVPRLVLKDSGIWNVQCARLPSTLCMYSITKGNTVETFRFDVRNGKDADPPQIDPKCNWSLSPDGSQRAIVVSGADQLTIQLRSTSTGKTRDLVVKGWSGLNSIDWSADGKSLLASWNDNNKREGSALLKVTLDGKASALLHSSNSAILYAIPSPDERRLAIAEIGGTKNVWLIDNF